MSELSKSEIYAKRDGIKVTIGSGRGRSTGIKIYHIPCDICGDVFQRKIYRGDEKQVCDICRANVSRKRKAIEKEELAGVKTKKEQAFDKAVNNIQKQVKNFGDYKKAIEIASTRVEKYGSIPEAMVAIELIKLGYSIIPQQKILTYKVDFAIPKQKLIIEVDGSIFHKDKYGGDREGKIQLVMGMEWEIIHIQAELISKDIKKLNKVINELLQHRGNK